MLLLLLACNADPANQDTAYPDPGPAPQVQAAAPVLRRLTAEQYRNSVTDVLGEGLILPVSLEPDAEAEGLLSVGAGQSSVSNLGVERYEAAALSLAEQVTTDPARLEALLPCTDTDRACVEQGIEELGLHAWRRPLDASEVQALGDLWEQIDAVEGSESAWLYTLAAMLQSPWFLYRVEHGLDGSGQLSDYELATRLSYFIWNTTPDAALLEAAAQGELRTDAVLEEQTLRLLADPRAQQGVASFFTELYQLYELDSLSKDPTVFLHASSELGPSARTETLMLLDHIVFQEPQDFRNLYTTQTTFIDRRLAALYQVPAPELEGFGQATLDATGGRRGLLGHASLLALHSTATRSSATLRGQFVRKVVLCTPVDPPPAGVSTQLPEADADGPTLRDRIQVHLKDPFCAGCHAVTDPVGLTLENFDGIGRWRETEGGATIDPSGDLDGFLMDDAWDLGEGLRSHPDADPCLASHVYRYGVGRTLSPSEDELSEWLGAVFRYQGHDFQALMLATAMSPGFRAAGGLQ